MAGANDLTVALECIREGAEQDIRDAIRHLENIVENIKIRNEVADQLWFRHGNAGAPEDEQNRIDAIHGRIFDALAILEGNRSMGDAF